MLNPYPLACFAGMIESPEQNATLLFHAGSSGFGSLLCSIDIIRTVPHSKRTAGAPDDVSHNIIIPVLTYWSSARMKAIDK